MDTTSNSLFAKVRRMAPSLDLDDDHQMNDACEYLLRSVGQKRWIDTENELISVALDGDVPAEQFSELDRRRLVQKGFAELVGQAIQTLGGETTS